MNDHLLPVRGSPGSPYTRKMLAVLRFRRIPYRYLQTVTEGLPKPRVNLIPVFYFTNERGEYIAEVDSTPIIRRLEAEYPGRSIIPPDPVVGFVNCLLEDYADEWLTKAMFHYRWHYAPDIDKAGSILPYYRDATQPEDVARDEKAAFSQRQIGRLYVVGSNDTTAPIIEDSYRRFLACLNEHLRRFPFLMGDRPGSSDFACFGQLTQLTQFDPTPSAIAAEGFPRVHAWVSKMDDLSGLEVREDGFLEHDDVAETLIELLKEVGRTYAPVMVANGEALNKDLGVVNTRVEDRAWVQQPFPYQGKCLQDIRIEYARLSDEHRRVIDRLLADTGCEALVGQKSKA